MTFSGFTIPDGAWLPPELIYLLPNISGSKLKAIIAILYHNLQVGGAMPLSLTDVENLTGLSRRAVIDALRELLEDEVIERQVVGDSFVYLPSLKASVNSSPGSAKSSLPSEKITLAGLRESERELNINLIKDSLPDSLNSPDASEKIALLQKLRSCGVYLKTAQELVGEHSGRVEEKIAFYRHALGYNLANGPGWLVQAIKEDWGEPLGWKKNGAGCGCGVCAPVREAGAYGGWDE